LDREYNFIYVVCQTSSNPLVKLEVGGQFPQARLAFSRPGFLTFKVPDGNSVLPELISTFSRTLGWGLGSIKGVDEADLVAETVQRALAHHVDHIHVFERDPCLPGEKHGANLRFEPGISPLAKNLRHRISELLHESGLCKQPQPASAGGADELSGAVVADGPACPDPSANRRQIATPTAPAPAPAPASPIAVNCEAFPRQLVLNLIQVDPGQFWFGLHRVDRVEQRWVGGVPQLPDFQPVSRAWYKIAEALRWSRIRLRPNDVCVELGSAPGGGCQRLLQLNAKIIAIDPAELHDDVVSHVDVTHIRRRGREVPRNLLRNAKWMISDANIVPYDLFSILDQWHREGVLFRGMLLNLKLARKNWFQEVDEYRAKVKGWGYRYVRTRQLAFNRGEICLWAARHKSVMRYG